MNEIQLEKVEFEPGKSFKLFSPRLRNTFLWHYHPEVELVYFKKAFFLIKLASIFVLIVLLTKMYWMYFENLLINIRTKLYICLCSSLNGKKSVIKSIM